MVAFQKYRELHTEIPSDLGQQTDCLYKPLKSGTEFIQVVTGGWRGKKEEGLYIVAEQNNELISEEEKI